MTPVQKAEAFPGNFVLTTVEQAVAALGRAWPLIVDETRAVLGGELHYQAVIYHCLRATGVPRTQVGMNVKQWITDPVTPLFRQLDARKHELYRGGFEPIPDIVLFNPNIAGDWRRRRREVTLKHMLLAIEVKASERDKGRLRASETMRDVHKLAAHRDEVRHRGGDMCPVVLIIDTAVEAGERMRDTGLCQLQAAAVEHGVGFYYVSAEREISPPAF